MKHQNKKGFTIVELVIVIAVIAILAAVLIPTFSSIVKKAQVSNDNQLVRNLNTALSASATKPANATEALAQAKEFGFDLAKISAKVKDNDILWDSENNCFCYLDNGEVKYLDGKTTKPADEKLWAISDSVSEKYATYYTGEADALEVSKSFDVGTGKVANLTFKTTAEGEFIVRTNGGTLTVDAPNATVKHYGSAKVLNVNAVASASYHEFGQIAKAIVKDGRFVAEDTATIAAVCVVAVKDEGNNVVVKQVNIEVKASAQVAAVAVDEAIAEALTTNIETFEKVADLAAELAKPEAEQSETVKAVLAAVENVETAIEKAVEKAEADQAAAPAEVLPGTQPHDHVWVKNDAASTPAKVGVAGVTAYTCSVEGCSAVKTELIAPLPNPTTGETTELVKPAVTSGTVKIGNAQALIAFRDAYNQGKYNDKNVTVELLDDIDLAGIEWTPIGTWINPFHGTFDGKSHTISNLTKTTSSGAAFVAKGNHIGLGEVFGFFGFVGGGDVVVTDLTLDDVNVNLADGKQVAALIGYAPNNDKFAGSGYNYANDNTIGNCNVTVSKVNISGSVSAAQHVASVIGKFYANGNLTVEECNLDVNVTAKGDYAGMVFGYLFNNNNETNNSYKATFNDVTIDGSLTQPATAGLLGVICGKGDSKKPTAITLDIANITVEPGSYKNNSTHGSTQTGWVNFGDVSDVKAETVFAAK